MLENVIKKLFPIRDEKNRPCTFPNFGSQVFGDDEEGRALWQDGKGFYADRSADSEKLGGADASEYAKKTDISDVSNESGMISDAWQAGKYYPAQYYCIHENTLYKCKANHTSGSTFDAMYWEATNVSSEIVFVNQRVDVSNDAIATKKDIWGYLGQNNIAFEIDGNYLYVQVFNNGVGSLFNVEMNKIV